MHVNRLHNLSLWERFIIVCDVTEKAHPIFHTEVFTLDVITCTHTWVGKMFVDPSLKFM